jgi:hypothetical protein
LHVRHCRKSPLRWVNSPDSDTDQAELNIIN